MAPVNHISKLVDASVGRLTFALDKPWSRPSAAHSLARQLDEQEMAAEIVASLDICGDPVVRERARLEGRVIWAEVTEVYQPKRWCKPCRIKLRTVQEVLRLRAGTSLQTLDGGIRGRVIDVSEGDQDSTLIELDLMKGVQKSTRPQIGNKCDWTDAVVINTQIPRARAYAEMKKAASPLAYQRRRPPSPTPSHEFEPGHFTQIAEQLRRDSE